MHSDDIRALYEPLPELPVLLIGGVQHNQIIHVEKAGPEVQEIKLPVRRKASVLFKQKAGEEDFDIHVYAYDRLNDDDHMWHYKFVGKD